MIIGNGTIITCVADSVERLAVTVTNNSDTITKTTVVITFTFPAGLEAAAVQPSPPTQGVFDGVDEWTMPSLTPLDSHTFDLNLVVTDSTQKPWTGSNVLSYTVVTDQTPDDDPSNDTATRAFDFALSCEDFLECTTVGEHHGDVLYVSIEGDNLTAIKGDGHRPWRDPWAAAEAADNFDTVYVYPGIYRIGDGGDSNIDVVWTGAENFFFPNRSGTASAYIYWHFDERVVISSSVDDPAFNLFDSSPWGIEGARLIVTGSGSFYIKAGTVFNIPINTNYEVNVEIDSYVTDGYSTFSELDERDRMFMTSYFEGHTNIKINSIYSRGPNLLSMASAGGRSVENAIQVDIGIWYMQAPSSLAAEITAGTDDSIMNISRYDGEPTPTPMNIEFNIGSFKSIWKAKGLLCNIHTPDGWDIENISLVYNIRSWIHIDALIDDGTPYVIDGSLTPYRSGTITDTSTPGAMVYLASSNPGGILENNSIIVNVGSSNFNGLLFDNYDNAAGGATTRNMMVFTSKEHKQSGTPFTVRNGSNSATAGVSKVVVDVLSGFVDAVPFHLENPLAADSGPKRYISGAFECVGDEFIEFNDQVCNRALTLKNVLIVTDQTNSIFPLTGSDTNQILMLSSASNKVSEAGLTELGQPLTIDASYE